MDIKQSVSILFLILSVFFTGAAHAVVSNSTTRPADLIVKKPWADIRAYGAVEGQNTVAVRAANTTAINNAITSQLAVHVPIGDWYVNCGGVVLKNNTRLGGEKQAYAYGPGIAQASTNKWSRIICVGTGPVLKLDQSWVSGYTGLTIENLALNGDASDTATGYGIDLTFTGANGMLNDIHVRNVFITNTGSHGIYSNTIASARIQNSVFEKIQIGYFDHATYPVKGDGINLKYAAETSFRDILIWKVQGTAIKITGFGQGLNFDRVTAQGYGSGNLNHGLYIEYPEGVNIAGFYGEGFFDNTTPTRSAIYLVSPAGDGYGGVNITGSVFASNNYDINVAGTTRNVNIEGNWFYWNSSTPSSAPTVVQVSNNNNDVWFGTNLVYPTTQTLTNGTDQLTNIFGRLSLTNKGIYANLRGSSTAIIAGETAAVAPAISMYSKKADGTLTERLQLTGGEDEPTFELKDTVYLKPAKRASLPAASVTYRGKIVRIEGGAGVSDHVYICIKNGTDVYQWVQLNP